MARGRAGSMPLRGERRARRGRSRRCRNRRRPPSWPRCGSGISRRPAPAGCACQRLHRTESGRTGRRRPSPPRRQALPRPLKDQMHGAVEVVGFGEIARSTEQHRRMPVMPAGVRAPVILRAVGQVGCLLDRQCIHIGAQPDRTRRIAGAQPADHPGLADPAKHLTAEFGEPCATNADVRSSSKPSSSG